jgi:hypothetical protein
VLPTSADGSIKEDCIRRTREKELSLLGDTEPDESNTLNDLQRHAQHCPPDHRPIAELFEVENLFDNLTTLPRCRRR